MMADFTDIGTVEDAWQREVTPSLMPTVDLFIGWASAIIRRNIPGIDRRIADGLLDPTLAQMVATNMVVRVLRNPQAIRQESVGGESVTYDTSIASGLLQMSDDEIAMLQPAASNGGYGSIRLRPGLF